jgi:hypothetical protein
MLSSSRCLEYMEHSHKQFESFMTSLKEPIKSGNFAGAMSACEDFNRFFFISEDYDALIISETFSRICLELDSLTDTFRVAPENIDKMGETLTKSADDIEVAYSEMNKMLIYETLKSLRAYATGFQFTHWHNSPRRSE